MTNQNIARRLLKIAKLLLALGPETGRYKCTAGQLSEILFGTPDAMNKGGNWVPELNRTVSFRKIPFDAPVTIVERHPQAVVTDDDGKWIADRFGPVLGVRDWKKVQKGLADLGITKEPVVHETLASEREWWQAPLTDQSFNKLLDKFAVAAAAHVGVNDASVIRKMSAEIRKLVERVGEEDEKRRLDRYLDE